MSAYLERFLKYGFLVWVVLLAFPSPVKATYNLIDCDLFEDSPGRLGGSGSSLLDATLTNYLTEDQILLTRRGCRDRITLMPSTTQAVVSTTSPVVYRLSRAVTLGVRPARVGVASQNTYGVTIQRCHPQQTRVVDSMSSRREMDFCPMGSAEMVPVVPVVIDASGLGPCPIKVHEGARLSIQNLTIYADDPSRVICKDTRNEMGVYESLPSNVLLPGIDRMSWYVPGNYMPMQTASTATSPNEYAWIYRVNYTRNPAMMGMAGMSGMDGMAGMAGNPANPGETTCTLNYEINADASGYILRPSSSGSLVGIRASGRVSGTSQPICGEGAVRHFMGIPVLISCSNRSVQPVERTTYSLTCSFERAKSRTVQVTLDPLPTVPMRQALTCSPATSSVTREGNNYRLSMTVGGYSSGTLSCSGTPSGMTSPTAAGNRCEWVVTPAAGMTHYAVTASVSGYDSCTVPFDLDLESNMGGSGGGTAGTGGSSFGMPDCHMDVYRTESGYRLSWTLANASSARVTMNGTPVEIPMGQQYVDVRQADITSTRTYQLTLLNSMGMSACMAAIEPVVLSPSPTCSFPTATRNANGTYEVTYTATNASSMRFTEGPGAPTNLMPAMGGGETRGSFTTPMIAAATNYAMTVQGNGAIPSTYICTLNLNPARNDGEDVAPRCRDVAIDAVRANGSWQLTLSVPDDATVNQLQIGTASPQSLDFSGVTATGGVKRLNRTETVTSPTRYVLTARKRAGGPFCSVERTLMAIVPDDADDPDLDHDGICNRRVDPLPSSCHYGPNDGLDNCPLVYNPDQADDNFDGVGDVCLNPDTSPLERAYAEGGGLGCEMTKASSKSLETLIPFLVIVIGFGFLRIGFGKNSRSSKF